MSRGSILFVLVLALLGVGCLDLWLFRSPAAPFADVQELILVQDVEGGSIAASCFAALRTRKDLFKGVAAFSSAEGVLGDGPGSERLRVFRASDDFFPTLGLQPWLGRHLIAGEGRSDRPQEALLGHDLWQQRFAGDAMILGSSIEVDAAAANVVGVLAPGFLFPSQVDGVDVVLPLAAAGTELRPEGVGVLARVRRDVAAQRLESELAAVEAAGCGRLSTVALASVYFATSGS